MIFPTPEHDRLFEHMDELTTVSSFYDYITAESIPAAPASVSSFLASNPFGAPIPPEDFDREHNTLTLFVQYLDSLPNPSIINPETTFLDFLGINVTRFQHEVQVLNQLRTSDLGTILCAS